MDDLIRRREAIAALGERPLVWVGSAYEIGARNQYDCDRLAVETTPTVDAVPVVHGRWIEISSSNHTYKCSECGRLLVNITDGKNNVAKHYPYCHCGARMDGKGDDENG